MEFECNKNAKSECGSSRTTERSDEAYRSLYNRLKRIEGQVRGVIGMLENDAYCIDILTQISAISSALSSFSCELLDRHVKGCVIDGIREGRDEVADELVIAVARLIK